MSRLPLDICREIFLLSSAESLISFRAVCKGWRGVIDDPHFVQAHTNQQLSSSTILIRHSTGPPFHPLYSLDLETLDSTSGLQSIPAARLDITLAGLSRLPQFPAASCNGLMLLPPSPTDLELTNWEIWNPLTHERLQLPRRDSVARSDANGLAYDFATDDYKAVVIVGQGSDSDLPVRRTHVYSLRSDSWKEIADFPPVERHMNWPVGVFLNGALHWITYHGIIVLDLATESYRQLDPPIPLGKRDRDTMWCRVHGIDVLDGCLMVTDYGADDYDYTHFDLWVMKDYTSWLKVFAFDSVDWSTGPGIGIKPVAYMKNKMQVFMQDGGAFYLLDVASNSLKSVTVNGLTENVSAQYFQGSIFRLRDNCGRVIGEGSVTEERRERKISNSDIDTELNFCVVGCENARHYSHYNCFSLDCSTEDEEGQDE